MSGIIGSAGSKSGVIGVTELDYEEGTHVCTTPTPGLAIPLGTYKTIYYTKIGNYVYVVGQIGFTGAGNNNADFYLDLPFVSISTAGRRQATVANYYNTPTSEEALITIYNGSSGLYISVDADTIANGDEVVFAIGYMTASS